MPRCPGSCAAWVPTARSASYSDWSGLSYLGAICQRLMSKWTPKEGSLPCPATDGLGYSPDVPVPRSLQSSMQVWGPDSDTGLLPISEFPLTAVELMLGTTWGGSNKPWVQAGARQCPSSASWHRDPALAHSLPQRPHPPGNPQTSLLPCTL